MDLMGGLPRPVSRNFMISIVFFIGLVIPCASNASEESEPEHEHMEIIYSNIDDSSWRLFVEPGLAIGGVNNGFHGMGMEQFGVELRDPGEGDEVDIRLGFGFQKDMWGIYTYGGTGILFPGIFFDNHGPFIPAELLLVMNEMSLGMEGRLSNARIRAGYSSVSGHATLYPEDTSATSSDPLLETDIDRASGYHVAVGLLKDDSFPGLGIEYVYHRFRLRLKETLTGAEPEEATVTQWEIRFFAHFRFHLFR